MTPLFSDAVRHAHEGFAYLLFIAVVSQLVLTFIGAGNNPKVARIYAVIQILTVRVMGPLIILAGCVLWWAHRASLPPNTWWIWATLLLWGPVELTSKRMVAPAILVVVEGGNARGTLIKASLVQLFCVAGAFGLMQANSLALTIGAY